MSCQGFIRVRPLRQGRLLVRDVVRLLRDLDVPWRFDDDFSEFSLTLIPLTPPVTLSFMEAPWRRGYAMLTVNQASIRLGWLQRYRLLRAYKTRVRYEARMLIAEQIKRGDWK